MLIWGFVFAGIAFGVLVAFLWITDRELREKNQRLEVIESRLAAVSGGSVGSPEAPAAGEAERIAKMEGQITELSKDRARLLAEVERLKEKPNLEPQQSPTSLDAEAEVSDLKGKITGLTAENAQLNARIENLQSEQNGREAKVQELEGERLKIADLVKRVAELTAEKSELAQRMAILEKENGDHRQTIQLLQGTREKVSALERQTADLSEEKAKLSMQLSDLRTSMTAKLKAQLEGLQDLYQKVESDKS